MIPKRRRRSIWTIRLMTTRIHQGVYLRKGDEIHSRNLPHLVWKVTRLYLPSPEDLSNLNETRPQVTKIPPLLPARLIPTTRASHSFLVCHGGQSHPQSTSISSQEDSLLTNDPVSPTLSSDSKTQISLSRSAMARPWRGRCLHARYIDHTRIAAIARKKSQTVMCLNRLRVRDFDEARPNSQELSAVTSIVLSWHLMLNAVTLTMLLDYYSPIMVVRLRLYLRDQVIAGRIRTLHQHHQAGRHRTAQ